MIIGDLYIVWTVCLPYKKDAVLIVDADTMLSLSLLLKALKFVPGRHAQIRQLRGRVHLIQLSKHD